MNNRGRLRLAIENFIDTFHFGDIFSKWTRRIIDDLENDAFSILGHVADSLGMGEVKAYIFDKLIKARESRSAPGWLIVVVGGLLGMVWGVVSGASRPFAREAEYWTDRKQQTYRPPPRDLVALRLMGAITADQYTLWSQDQGAGFQVMAGYRELSERTPDPAESMSLYLRGYISETELSYFMLKQGVTPEHLQQYKNLYKLVPGPQDLIHMQVREAWNEEVVQRFDYDAGDHAEFDKWMGAQGYDSDWSKRYWRAHWVIPGLESAYEMLHRLRPGKSDIPFTPDDLETVLRVNDVPEFFRKRLEAVSYNPYTRVDVRRMFSFGILTEDQVKSAYLDLGYDEEHATNLTKFTVSVEAPEDKGLNNTSILAAYRRGLIDKVKAVSQMADIGYPAELANYLLDQVDYDLEQQVVDEKLKDIQARFVSGELDEQSVMGVLGPLNLASDRQTRLLSIWAVQRRNRVKKPSVSDLDKFYRQELITQDDLLKGLERQGYVAADAELYVKNIDLDKAGDAAKEAERATKEAERLAALTTAKESSRAMALIDADIAELSLELANIRVVRHAELAPEDDAVLAARLDEISVEIAAKRLDKARIRAGS